MVPRFFCIYTKGAFGADVPTKEKLTNEKMDGAHNAFFCEYIMGLYF